jgi:hypothetical protein
MAIELFGLGEAMMRGNLRRQYPEAGAAEIEQKLTQWLRDHPLLWSAEATAQSNGPARRQL